LPVLLPDTAEIVKVQGWSGIDRGFTLPDAYGGEVSLKTLLAKGPVVVSFYRGEWCPYCNIERPRIARSTVTFVGLTHLFQ
jgi:peroxiredoxin